jgi:hypothetical protein
MAGVGIKIPPVGDRLKSMQPGSIAKPRFASFTKTNFMVNFNTVNAEKLYELYRNGRQKRKLYILQAASFTLQGAQSGTL